MTLNETISVLNPGLPTRFRDLRIPTTSTQTGTTTGLGISTTISNIETQAGATGISSVTPDSGPITWQGGSGGGTKPQPIIVSGGPVSIGGTGQIMPTLDPGGITGLWSERTLISGEPIVNPGWWNTVPEDDGGIDDSWGDIADQIENLTNIITSGTDDGVSDEEQKIRNITYGDIWSQLSQGGKYDVRDLNLGWDENGNPYVISATVRPSEEEEKTVQVYEMLGYDSQVQYAYNAMSGHVREPTGRKATIFDYATGAGAMELAPYSYVHDYKNYYDSMQGIYQDYRYDYQIPYRYRRMRKWLS
jgi:hypothetical protein